MAPLLRLYSFKYRDPVSGSWIKARYKATIEDIRARYAEWMIAGEPEIRGNVPSASFNPYTAPRAKRRGEPSAIMQPQRQRPPAIDAMEVFLVSSFLPVRPLLRAAQALCGNAGRRKPITRDPTRWIASLALHFEARLRISTLP
jgi:hypothetical protein